MRLLFGGIVLALFTQACAAPSYIPTGHPVSDVAVTAVVWAGASVLGRDVASGLLAADTGSGQWNWKSVPYPVWY